MAEGEVGRKRELIDTSEDKRFVRRGGKGQFKESADVGRFLKQDRQQKAKTEGEERAQRSGRQNKPSNQLG